MATWASTEGGVHAGSGEEGREDVTVYGHRQDVASTERVWDFTAPLSNLDGFEVPSEAMPTFIGIRETWWQGVERGLPKIPKAKLSVQLWTVALVRTLSCYCCSGQVAVIYYRPGRDQRVCRERGSGVVVIFVHQHSKMTRPSFALLSPPGALSVAASTFHPWPVTYEVGLTIFSFNLCKFSL